MEKERYEIEAYHARWERSNRRLFIIAIVALIMFFVSNAMWLYAWMQYDYVSDESSEVVVHADGEGNANYIGNDGDITN